MKIKNMKVFLVVCMVVFALVTLFGFCSSVAHAQKSLLDEIIDRGTIRIGMIMGLPPYSVFDPDTKEPRGSDVDVALAVAGALGVELEIVETSAPNRIPYLITERVDLIIACFTVTPERAKSIGFTKPYLAIDIALLGRKEHTDVKSYKDLSGHSIAVPRGTTQDIFMTENAPEGTKILRFDDSPIAYQAFKQGQADTLALAATVVQQWIEGDPSLETKGILYKEYEAMATRRNELEFINWLNILIDDMGSKQQLANIYRKWFAGEPSGMLYEY